MGRSWHKYQLIRFTMNIGILCCFVTVALLVGAEGKHIRLRREAFPDPLPQRGQGGRSIQNRGRAQNRFFFGQAGNAGLAGDLTTRTPGSSLAIQLWTTGPLGSWLGLLGQLCSIMLLETTVAKPFKCPQFVSMQNINGKDL